MAGDINSLNLLATCISVFSLIVASKFHATPIVMSLMDYIAPSRQILVFSQFKEVSLYFRFDMLLHRNLSIKISSF